MFTIGVPTRRRRCTKYMNTQKFCSNLDKTCTSKLTAAISFDIYRLRRIPNTVKRLACDWKTKCSHTKKKTMRAIQSRTNYFDISDHRFHALLKISTDSTRIRPRYLATVTVDSNLLVVTRLVGYRPYWREELFQILLLTRY